MPVLPSGRRVEFSLDRFHGLLYQLEPSAAQAIASSLQDPDDLLYVLDAVHFSLTDGTPFFADYLASDWLAYAAEWSTQDREAFQNWLESSAARQSRAEAIDYIWSRVLNAGTAAPSYPYELVGDNTHINAAQAFVLQ